MLHGRHGFRQHGVARRHLRGCYVNIDEFANRSA
jgi:alpha-ketoglutarate-dependent taurine dioxygenase|tara:strand:- start:292 stop:393 length:102 start_codon:yes stop_codon:yes gene_type:complete